MKDYDSSDTPAARARGGRMRIPRSRGAASGFLLILLGLWGALVPFIGPYFDFAFTPDQVWAWTTARGWLEVLPGVVTVVGGFLMLTSRNRATAMLGGWLTVAAGAWFVIGRALAGPLGLGNAGAPVATNDTKRVWLELTYFYGLGALIVFLGAIAIGRLSVRSARDIAYAQRPVETTTTGSQPVIEQQPVRQDPVVGQQPVGQQTGYGPAADQPVGQQTGYGPAADQSVGQQTGYGPVAGQQQVEAAPRRRGLLSRLRNRGGGNTLAHR
jgi:hypothetical protein